MFHVITFIVNLLLNMYLSNKGY